MIVASRDNPYYSKKIKDFCQENKRQHGAAVKKLVLPCCRAAVEKLVLRSCGAAVKKLVLPCGGAAVNHEG
jgi:hypothetical protein